jgi:hypothetical protein
MESEIKNEKLKEQLDVFAQTQRKLVDIVNRAFGRNPEIQTIMYQLILVTIQNKSLTRYLMQTGQINGTEFAKIVNEVTDEMLKEFVAKSEKPNEKKG